jgi:hypothetical protein
VIPYVYKTYFGYSSAMRVFNPGPNATTANFSFYLPDGTPNALIGVAIALNPGGSSGLVPPPPYPTPSFFGLARVQSSNSNQPLAVTVDHLNTNIDISSQAALGSSTAYLPYIFKPLHLISQLSRWAMPPVPMVAEATRSMTTTASIAKTF